MIERELFELITAKAINAAIAYVRRNCSLRHQHERTGRRTHAFEVGILRAARMDAAIGFFKSELQRRGGSRFRFFEVLQRNRIDGDFARQFARSMPSHAVCDDEHMPAAKEIVFVSRRHEGHRILIVRPSQADVGELRVVEKFLPVRRR